MVWIRGDGEVCARAPVWADVGLHWLVIVACVVGVLCCRSAYIAMALTSLSFIAFNMCFYLHAPPRGIHTKVARLPHVA